MPVFYEHVNDFAKIAIWHIAEEKDFFLKKVFLHREIKHPHKQLQHLAGRYLLQYLYPDFPYHLMKIAGTGKPYLPNKEFHFSISHSGDYAAVIISKDHYVGIDIELVTQKVEKIKYKFLNDKELENIQYSIFNTQYSSNNVQLLTNNLSLLTLLWSCKEAVFKWYGNGDVDFRNNINLKTNNIDLNEGLLQCEFIKEEKRILEIRYKFFEEFCLAFVISS